MYAINTLKAANLFLIKILQIPLNENTLNFNSCYYYIFKTFNNS